MTPALICLALTVYYEARSEPRFVEGQLVGDIHGEEVVTLAGSSNVTGNIFSRRIVIEDGAKFNGKIEMGERAKVTLVPKKPV